MHREKVAGSLDSFVIPQQGGLSCPPLVGCIWCMLPLLGLSLGILVTWLVFPVLGCHRTAGNHSEWPVPTAGAFTTMHLIAEVLDGSNL